ncbi:4-hydroxy-tetrahydrodipicolinate reductase [Psychroflexus aestuariivivens]|uniref:4-hydroxy-tetrahydrodipicolinate reductase n=1 Tax=Psychroflexus aestuariivivens TaxID=1795040 RepID=UPI000FD86318|nr:4-hydroxy-tetrahydrodipicolinate reductase [Psychroflexus aestuariivivens]
MKIAILGYGKMGKTVEKIAQNRQHEIVFKTSEKLDIEKLKSAEVAIDFSTPEAAFENITTCLKYNIPVISGTTGWLDKFEKTKNICRDHKGRFLYASNFSIGVNIFFEVNAYLAEMMANMDSYNVNLKEIHHLEKKDAPSGTAISLAEQIIDKTRFTNWNYPPKQDNNSIPIEAERKAGIFGIHEITYESEIDKININHEAKSRDGFAFGAVVAAEWIINQDEGVYEMKNVLQNKNKND